MCLDGDSGTRFPDTVVETGWITHTSAMESASFKAIMTPLRSIVYQFLGPVFPSFFPPLNLLKSLVAANGMTLASYVLFDDNILKLKGLHLEPYSNQTFI